MRHLHFAIAIALFTTAAHAETAIAPEASPPGDIPDNQAFVIYAPAFGYVIKIPEGWALKVNGNTATFNDKYNHITLVESSANQAVDETYVKSTLIPELQKNGRAIGNIAIKTIKTRAGAVVQVTYDSNSEPNAVTNKQVREENERLYFVKNRKLAELTLSAPKGADNVDQWNLMVSSFRWK